LELPQFNTSKLYLLYRRKHLRSLKEPHPSDWHTAMKKPGTWGGKTAPRKGRGELLKERGGGYARWGGTSLPQPRRKTKKKFEKGTGARRIEVASSQYVTRPCLPSIHRKASRHQKGGATIWHPALKKIRSLPDMPVARSGNSRQQSRRISRQKV